MTTVASDDLVHVTGGEDCSPYFDRATAHIREARKGAGVGSLSYFHRLAARGEWRDGRRCEAINGAEANAG